MNNINLISDNYNSETEKSNSHNNEKTKNLNSLDCGNKNSQIHNKIIKEIEKSGYNGNDVFGWNFFIMRPRRYDDYFTPITDELTYCSDELDNNQEEIDFEKY